MTDWLPEDLHPVAMRLARADAAAEELALLALKWSRGLDDKGAVTLRQVERTRGIYDVEVATVQPIPPVAAMLFSEAVHHLRSAVDNAVFSAAERANGQPFSSQHARTVSMLVYDDSTPYERKWKGLVRQGLAMFDPAATLGKRVASLQPFNDQASLPSMNPLLARMMGVEVVNAHPLGLLRDYSNEDKHRTIRIGAAGATVQVLNERWQESINKGMRFVEAGLLLEQVPKGATTGMEISAALQVQRPDGTWVAYGPELDGMARHVADIVIPTLITGMALPSSIPAHIDLSDNGENIAQRLANGGTERAHERVQAIMAAALLDSEQQDWKFPPVEDDPT